MFNDLPPPEIYTLSLHDALPIFGWPSRVVTMPTMSGSMRCSTSCSGIIPCSCAVADVMTVNSAVLIRYVPAVRRSEEHTSELQSRRDLVCRLLLEKKNDGYSRSF